MTNIVITTVTLESRTMIGNTEMVSFRFVFLPNYLFKFLKIEKIIVFSDQGPIEPPGYEKVPGPSFSLSERRPGSEFQSGAPPPPPSFSNERPSNFASSHSGLSCFYNFIF